MAFQLKFAGVTLDGVEEWADELRNRIDPETFPRRDGSIVQEAAFKDPIRLRLPYHVSKADEATLKTYLNSLGSLMESGRDKLYLRDDNRYLNAIITGLSRSHRAGDAAALTARGVVEFLIDDPYFYSDTESASAEQNPSASPHIFSITNSGKARTPVRIEIKADGVNVTDVKLTNTTTSLFARFSGTITANNTLVIDCKKRSVQNGGANGLNSFTGSFWELEQGVNNLEYIGPVDVLVTAYHTERWILN